jgi:hypothetical protein
MSVNFVTLNYLQIQQFYFIDCIDDAYATKSKIAEKVQETAIIDLLEKEEMTCV